jgi:hypothetical protein
MNKDDGVYVDGQGVQVPAAPVPLMATNEDMQKIGVSDTSGFASTKIKSMLSEPGFRSGDAFITEDEINKRMDVGRDPYWDMDTGRTSFADLEFKSSVPQIVKDEVVKFGMGIQNLGDKARVALGGITALATNNKIGAEMRDRAYDTLESATRRMSLENTNAADAETLTAQVTQGASSMLEMIATGLVTGGIAPLAQMGVEAMGDGTYNNMIKYASEHDGSIEGYQGNWLETGIDLANAVVQVGIERYLGVGSNRFLRGTGGHFLKEAVEGFAQESSQDFLTDLSEYLKGNGDAPTNWEQYMISGVIGGLLQGTLGAATYKYSRTQADNELSNLIFKATKARHPEKDDATLYKESRQQAKAFNDDVEAGIVKNSWDELANRVDANNDRGKVRDNLVSELTKARVAALGLESADELDADDLADIQDAATVAAGEAFRESFIEGKPIEQTLTARLVADGKDLVVRDLTPEERGVREISRVDLQADEDALAQQIGTARESLARARLETELQAQQTALEEERARRKADVEELQAWAEQQVRLGEEIGRRRERGQTEFSLREINRWLRQSSRSEQARAREERKASQVRERKKEIAQKPLPKEQTPETEPTKVKPAETKTPKKTTARVAETKEDTFKYEGSEYDLSRITTANMAKAAQRQLKEYLAQRESQKPTGEFEDWSGKTRQEVGDFVLQKELEPVFDIINAVKNEDNIITDDQVESRKAQILNEKAKDINWARIIDGILMKYDLDPRVVKYVRENPNMFSALQHDDYWLKNQNNTGNQFVDVFGEYVDAPDSYIRIDELDDMPELEGKSEDEKLKYYYEHNGYDDSVYLLPKNQEQAESKIIQTMAEQTELSLIEADELDSDDPSVADLYDAKKNADTTPYLFQQSLQNVAKGVVSDTGRGAYNSRYQRIILNKDSDVSTILHELSHMWLNNWFKAYRAENAPESFRKWWRPVERALGIRESDRFLDQDASEKFARSFEKWVLDGGKGAESSLAPVYERLSKRLADIYDDLATRYFDMVADLKPEVQSWFAKNEALADSMIVDVPERNEETGETTTEQVRVQYRDRAAERESAQKMAETEEKAERTADRAADEINEITENVAGEQLAPDSDEPAQSPYTAEGQREQRTSQRIKEEASAEGVLIEARKYDPLMAKRAAEDAVIFATTDLDSAFEVAMGRKNAPGDVPRIAVFFAVKNRLMLNPAENVARLQELAKNSPVITELSEAGKKLRMAGVAMSKDDPLRILRDLSKMYDENLTAEERAKITENINQINEYINRADLDYEDTWNKILSDMECRQ